ncbi:beta-glucosidase 6 [Coccomyxa sp. Obi]|nr:beta-glucosidase 6 [Coccomyxa sp. Obi]
MVHENATGNVACDFYHRYPEDLRLAKRLHAKSFRFSVAWARIYPNGDGPVNQAGLDYYSKMVDTILELGMVPAVTLYHWDVPEELQRRFGGWNSREVVSIFTNYAATVFNALGDRVTYWTTINEPNTFCWQGYGTGMHAPGIRDPMQTANCSMNVLYAHAAAVKEFRKIVPGGKIAMNLNAEWSLPFDSNNVQDQEAAQRKQDFEVGVFADAVYFGQFPDSVRARVPYLPEIPDDLAQDLAGSFDYFALNHYTSSYAQYDDGGENALGRCDYNVTHTSKDGMLIGEQGDSGWLYSVPWGFRKVLNYINDRYKPSEISITENGFNVKGESFMTMDEITHDTHRVKYFQEYIRNAIAAFVYDNVPISNYHAWALMDNFEWTDGYSKHFGVCFTNFTSQERILKASARYLANEFADVQ